MRRDTAQHAIPLAYFVIAATLIALVVPTALRPPAPPSSSSAEFDPNEPPDETQDAIISNLSRPTSQTAGGPASDAVPGVQGPTGLAAAPRFCPGGFGSPPRQVESLYSAPCSPAWTGDNGGATWRGVTRSEIRLAVVYRGGDTGLVEGPVSDEPTPNESAPNRTLRVYQRYFNQRFQTYGRTLRLYAVAISTNVDNQRAGAVRAAEEHKAFGSVGIGAASVPYMEEAVRRKLVAFGGVHFSNRWISKHAPYVYDWETDSSAMLRLTAEYACKKLARKPAAYSGDPLFQETQRRFGFLYYSERPIYDTLGDELSEFLSTMCGEKLAESIYYGLREDAEQLATAITRFKAAGVTSIILFSEGISPIALTNAATQQGWFPEWILPGATTTVSNDTARQYNPAQWRSAFGLSFYELPREPEQTDTWRAYHSIDPDNDPHEATAEGFYPLLQYVNGIQLAGPRLTPESFAAGLFALPRRAPDPVWSLGGGYRPGDYTYSDYASELWWDPSATDPISGQPGAYRYTRGGARFTHGEVPREEPLVFKEGTTQ